MNCDVAILGGGMAGACLARQLLQRCPDLRVTLVERDARPVPKVGESTSEIASTYLGRRLGLTRYLYQRHLPKNGLRYFFDSEQYDAPLEQLGEIGTDALPFHPSFQIDRMRFDDDVRQMNVEAGVNLVEGTVRTVELAEDGQPHRITVEADGATSTLHARWVVDASGRRRLLARHLGRPRIDIGHEIHGAWGRFEGVADIDAFGAEAWRSRVRGTSRFLSTNHFFGPNYWIWAIPLSEGHVSLGIVSAGHFESSWRDGEGLLACFRRHRGLASLLERARPVHVASLRNVSYGCDTFVHRNRWACIGEAATFTDPFYSPGADFIALANDCVSDVVARDHAGEGEAALHERIGLYDDYLKHRVEANIRLYRGLYGVFASRQLFALKWQFDIASYYNLWLQDYLFERHLDLDHVREQLNYASTTLAALDNFASAFRRVAQHLQDTGRRHEGNLEHYAIALGMLEFVKEVGTPRARKPRLRLQGRHFNAVRDGLRELAGVPGSEPLPFYAFVKPCDLLA